MPKRFDFKFPGMIIIPNKSTINDNKFNETGS